MNLSSFRLVLASVTLLCGATGLRAQEVQVDPNLPDYKPVAGVSGEIKSIGSDTMNNLMTFWSEGFLKFYPNVKVEIEGKGSSTAPPALIEGTATFGPMSRKMKPAEEDAFEAKYGYKPTQLGTSIDMLAVYVHKDNPIQGLTLPQVDAMFSNTRKLGYPRSLDNWGQLGLTGSWANSPISLYGRNSASGTYAYFKKNVLGDGDYRNSVKEQPGSSAVVQGVARDKAGIGYSGIGYKTADVRALPLARSADGQMVPPTAEAAGKYPLARFLYLAVNHKPGSELPVLQREFVRYVFSKQGQQAVAKDGYLPVPATYAKKVLAQLGMEQ